MNLWTSTTNFSKRCMFFAAALLLGVSVSSFSSAVTFSYGGRSTLVKNGYKNGSSSSSGSVSGSDLSRMPVLMVPRGGELEDSTSSGSVEAAMPTESVSSTSTTTTTKPAENRPSSGSSILSRHLAMVSSPLAALKPAVNFYCTALAKYPIATNCATATVLSVASDAIAQSLERRGNNNNTDNYSMKESRHDFSRSAWMAVWGAIMAGLMIHYWFIFLNGLFPVEGLTLVGALKKVTVNQLVMSPGMNGLFFSFTTYTRGDIVGNKAAFLKKKLAADLVPTMKRSCVYWGTVQMVNFLLVPPRFAVLYTNIGFLLWTTYISLVGYRTVASKQ